LARFVPSTPLAQLKDAVKDLVGLKKLSAWIAIIQPLDSFKITRV